MWCHGSYHLTRAAFTSTLAMLTKTRNKTFAALDVRAHPCALTRQMLAVSVTLVTPTELACEAIAISNPLVMPTAPWKTPFPARELRAACFPDARC